MRIGILGGTFDPPHKGHLAVAETCLRELNLDEVLFLPASRNPLKDKEETSPNRARLEMVKLAIAGHAGFALSDMDITRGGRSYAVDTLSELHMVRQADYWFILGADAAKLLPQWKQPERLVRLCRIALVARPALQGEPDILRKFPPFLAQAVDVVRMEPVDISATTIRERIEEKRDVSSMVPAPVLDYIRANRLYES